MAACGTKNGSEYSGGITRAGPGEATALEEWMLVLRFRGGDHGEDRGTAWLGGGGICDMMPAKDGWQEEEWVPCTGAENGKEHGENMGDGLH